MTDEVFPRLLRGRRRIILTFAIRQIAALPRQVVVVRKKAKIPIRENPIKSVPCSITIKKALKRAPLEIAEFYLKLFHQHHLFRQTYAFALQTIDVNSTC